MTDTAPLAAKLAGQKTALVAVNSNDVLPDTIAVPSVNPVPAEPQSRLGTPKVLGGIPHLDQLMRLSTAICRTEMVPQVLRGRPDAILAVMMAGAELGIGPMQSLQGIDLIQGRPALSAELMRALVVQEGHTFRLDQTDEAATVTCRRREWADDIPNAVFSWTIEDAKRAQLAGKDNYKKFPRAMLAARASSEAARAVFPDVIVGLSYTPEEVAEFSSTPPSDTTYHPVTNVPPVSAVSAAQTVPARREIPPARVPKNEKPFGPEDMTYSADKAAAEAKAQADASAVTEVVEPPAEPKIEPQELADEIVAPTERQQYARGLKEIIEGLPSIHQPVIKAYLRQRYGDSKKMTVEKLQEACTIAAGWPDTAGDPREGAENDGPEKQTW